MDIDYSEHYCQSCSNCKHFHPHRDNSCRHDAPVEVSPDDWGCSHHAYGFLYIARLCGVIVNLQKRLAKASKKNRQYTAKIRRLNHEKENITTRS